ncbi:TRAP transporter small permease subunit [Elioraea sp. Yellowstone]|jgi:TRAP-type mannitol/chloroaromatic compound transport system permease small subunit|uniref:TRAP transporter small permease subunit n=1 Tax=Elioraea sp. Yellowstone TaxID=2592070 RepID=UPI00114E6733|nr:TRAP transporter small permease subunit [Elioraea sp. Yellowstone]TQF76916.1 TRAP transporter small permease subunit [Elioraea sp. Yellowstone]
MQALLLTIDRISALAGKIAGWSIVVLTGVICYEVFARYLFRAPTSWAYDTSYMLYGFLFMLAGPYALSRNAHVRADFLYRSMTARRQAMFDLPLYILFFVPGMLALIWFGWNFAWLAYLQNERSSVTPEGPLIWPFKFLIPLSGGLMLLQGLAEMARCAVALRTGAWPPKLTDVEETEALALAEAQRAAAAGLAHAREESGR